MTPEGLHLPPDRASALIRQQFPELRGEVVLLGTGWDNTVMRVGERWAFRFPRRTEALGCQETELAVLPLLAGRVPLAVPFPQWHGVPAGDYPWPFWGGPLVPGQELCDAGLTDRTVLAAEIGAFLRVLHALPPPELPVDPMSRGLPAYRWVKAREALDELVSLGLWSWNEATGDLLEGARALGPSPRRVLVHGDLHLRHVLATADGHVGGVIDWGDSCLADPAVDLSFGYGAFTGPAREAFLSAYGDVAPDQQARARSLALGLAAILAVNAHEVGNAALLVESLAGISRSTAP